MTSCASFSLSAVIGSSFGATVAVGGGLAAREDLGRCCPLGIPGPAAVSLHARMLRQSRSVWHSCDSQLRSHWKKEFPGSGLGRRCGSLRAFRCYSPGALKGRKTRESFSSSPGDQEEVKEVPGALLVGV